MKRHLDETLPLIKQLVDVDVLKKPCPECKEVGEVVLHMLRSAEFYMRGVATNQWEPLHYKLEEYNSAEAIIKLANDVFKKVNSYANLLSSSDLGKKIQPFDTPATIGELLMEMIEHSIHHRGQITVYYRLLGVKPTEIQYIV